MNTWKKTFYTIWVGQAISQLTSSILQFAVVWYLTDKTGSGMILNLAMLAGFLPQGLLGPMVGVYIDRWNRKNIMVVADLFIAASSMLLFIAAPSQGAVSVELILGILLLRALGTAFHHPTLQAVTPQIVPEEELTKCAGYTQTLESFSMIASPAIAAILYNMWSLNVIVLVDVAGAAIAASLIIIVKIPKHVGTENTQKIQMIAEIKEGFQILTGNKGIFALVLVGCLYVVSLMPISALFPLMTMGHFGGGTAEASFIEIVFSVSYMMGAVLLARWGGTRNKVYTIILSYLIMGIALVISGLLPETGFLIFIGTTAMMGASGPLYWGVYIPILQRNFEEKYLGRVMSMVSSIKYIVGPIALVVSGFIADQYGEEAWFLVGGVLTLIGAVIMISSKKIRNCDGK